VTTEIDSHSEEQTMSAGRDLGLSLGPGTVVLLTGPLGAGKTAFVRGLAEGLGCDPAAVSSPTFTIIQEYAGRLLLEHVDLYRLTPVEADDLGIDDLISGSVVAVEWPDRWRRPPPDAIGVEIVSASGDERRIRVTRPDSSALPS
jgi:tRNA threonylcarbamoyladenosine biosynthesis protein TsaE